MSHSDDAVLSVIIPAHNAEGTIRAAVRSVLDQQVRGTEVIVIDDGSDVDLRSMLADVDCQVIRQPGSGVSVARNTGFRLARGSHVMFLDADDRLIDSTLDAFVGAAVRSAADVTVSDFLLRDGSTDVLVSALNSDRADFGEADRSALQRMVLARIGFGGVPNTGLLGAPWAKIYKRSFLDRALRREDLFDAGVPRGQDVLFNAEVFGLVRHVHYFRLPTYAYTLSEASSSHRQVIDFSARVKVLVAAVDALVDRRAWQELIPAVAKMTVTLFEEAMLRQIGRLTLSEVRRLRRSEPFDRAIRNAQLADFSRAGKIKLLVFRSGGAQTFFFMKVMSSLRTRRSGGARTSS